MGDGDNGWASGAKAPLVGGIMWRLSGLDGRGAGVSVPAARGEGMTRSDVGRGEKKTSRFTRN